MDISKFKKEDRGTLYYGRYRYSISAYLFEAAVLRFPYRIRSNPRDQHERLDCHMGFRESVLTRNINYGGSWAGNRTRSGGFREDDRQALHEALDWMYSQDPQQMKVVIYSNWLQIYVNDVTVLTQHEFYPRLQHVSVSEAVVTHAPDVIKLRDPQYSIRHYFRDRMLDQEERDRLARFLENYSQELRFSPNLRDDFLGRQRRWITANMFVDTNNSQFQLLLDLSFPRLVRKTYRIEPR